MCLLYEVGILGAGWFNRVSRSAEDLAERATDTAVDKPTDGS